MGNKTTAEIFNRADLTKVSHDDMQMSNELMSDYIEMTSATYPEQAKHLKMKLHLLLCDTLSMDVAEATVAKFINEDGTKGQHWGYMDTTMVLRDVLKKDLDPVMFYYALNKVYSDFYSPDFTDEVYFRMACQYINDKDGVPNKIRRSILNMWS